MNFCIVFSSKFLYTGINIQQKGIFRMAHNLISILMQHSEQIKPDTVTLWHTSNDPDTLKSFLDEGVKAIEKGYGGQAGGFYMWNNKKAPFHISISCLN